MKKLLVVRNDKLGDFMLAWPAFAMLKQSAPDWHITALVPHYTEDLARYCPYIDDVIIDAGKKGDKTSQQATLTTIRQAKFDASINFFSDTYNAFTVFKAGIPLRLAPATKFVQFLYNQRITQRRSRSLKPEYEYNLDLARAFLIKQGLTIQEPQPPYLSFSYDTLVHQRQKLANQLHIALDCPWIFVHAGSGGSANNLSLSQYAELIVAILLETASVVVLTAGPGETEKAQQLQAQVQARLANTEINAVKYFPKRVLQSSATDHQLSKEEDKSILGGQFSETLEKQLSAPSKEPCSDINNRVVIYDKNDGLVDFAQSLACADVFIAGSTGPLHICGALNIPTIGFYPSKRSATPLRWQTINQADKRLAFSPAQGEGTEDDLTTIEMQEVIKCSLPFIQQFCDY